MRVLVTGADGFLGRRLVTALPGHSVIGASRRPMPDVEWRRLDDMRGKVDWERLLAGVDAVVHLANIAHKHASEADFEVVNHQATAALGAAAARLGIRHVVYVSSIYAQVGHSTERTLDETDAPRPINAYGRSKLAAERAIAASGVPFTVLRPVLVLGTGAKGNAGTLERLADLPLPLPLASITARRSFLTAENFISGVVSILGQPRAIGETYIVADREPRTVGEVVAQMRAEKGRRAGIFAVPAGVIARGLGLIGAGDVWEKIGTPFLVSSRKLISLGWVPTR